MDGAAFSDSEVPRRQSAEFMNVAFSNSNVENTEKVLLTSRHTKKRVTIQDDKTDPQNSAISALVSSIDTVEKNFPNGFHDLKIELANLLHEKSAYETHIFNLERSLRQNAQERNRLDVISQQLRQENDLLKSRLNIEKQTNQNLTKDNENLKSCHEIDINSIADNHRKRTVTKRTFNHWKNKAKKPRLQDRNDLIAENERLKQEIIRQQKSYKKAFLRSSNVLNSEAIGVFQNTAKRLLQIDGQDTFSSSDSSSSRFNENDSNLSESAYENGENRSHRDSSKYLKKTHEINRREAFKSGGSSSRENFEPDFLRRETREIMKQLELNKPTLEWYSRTKSPTACSSSKSHVHICHCASMDGKGGICPYCNPGQNSKISAPIKMTKSFTPSKPKSLKLSTPNKVTKSFPPNRPKSDQMGPDDWRTVNGEKARVMYKPSGSTVIVEKHLP